MSKQIATDQLKYGLLPTDIDGIDELIELALADINARLRAPVRNLQAT